MRRSYMAACYSGTPDEWERIATHFEEHGEKRMANTIRAGIKRQSIKRYGYGYGYGWIGLKFRDGSIEKMESILSLFPEPEFVGLEP